ncbi:Detected protein of unknown function [Hibiscus syriacus]|uniref:F-box domain-containing protein n=1 Tax=Hibiscus syriacus TaxID=106335 RepID=A0A6A2YYB6_HIBSY|nr:Detected protein of unknown function [Hibiscus syriacus]
MSDYLPVEVIIDVLKWLPVEFLVKFRSVCKTWNRLFCDPSFVSAHYQASLSRPPNNTPLLLIRSSKNIEDYYFLNYDNDGFDEFKQFPFHVFQRVSHFMDVGSCNGLICLLSWNRDVMNFVLWNPSIQKYVSLPPPIIVFGQRSKFGLGFDSRTNDYKLLIVGVEKDGNLIQPCLFSVNENCWRRVAAIAPNYEVEGCISPAFVKGAFHWLGYHERNDGAFSNKILGFDFSAEEFFEINLPESLIGLCPSDLSIMNYGESSIAVLFRVNFESNECWMMKEYGVVESWTKVFVFQTFRGWYPPTLAFRNNGEVILRVGFGEIALHDLNCQAIEPRGVKIGDFLLSVSNYVESLALLDKGVDVRSFSDYAIDSSGYLFLKNA